VKPSRVFRFFVAASTLLLIASACTEIQGPNPAPGLPRVTLSAGTSLACAVTSWESTTGYIGPEGGTLYLPHASVSFPGGALVEKTLIAFSMGPEGTDSISVALYPRGEGAASLDLPAELTIDSSGCAGLDSPGAALSVSLAAVSDSGGVVLPESEAGETPRIVMSLITFAWYIIAE